MALQKKGKFFPEYLNQESKAPAMALVQCILMFRNYTSMPVPINGINEGETTKGIKRLQRDIGFKGDDKDGNFGPNTRKRYREEGGLDVNSLLTSIFVLNIDSDSSALSRKLFPEECGEGEDGPHVALLQCLLVDSGAFEGIGIEITGVWDEKTTQAILSMQGGLRIPQTGRLDKQTKAAIKENCHLDMDAIPAGIFQIETSLV